MFLGHYAVALAAKKAAPKVSLGTLFLSAQFIDLLWPIFLLLGLEHARVEPGNTALTPLNFYDYPLSHSLVGCAGWSLLLGLIYYVVRRDLRGSSVVAIAVFSHWVLDFITHRPDLPLGFGGDTFFGLGLWNWVVGTIVLEMGLFAAGVALYVRTTTTVDRVGTYAFWSLVVFLTAIYFMNIAGPPPPDVSAIAIAGNAAWLFVVWAYWIDRHRRLRSAGGV